MLFLLLLLKKVGSARLRESGIHPISPKTPAPQYQPIDRKKKKGKKVEDYSRDSVAAQAVRWSCELQPSLHCSVQRGAQGVLPCIGWGVQPVNWIYRL